MTPYEAATVIVSEVAIAMAFVDDYSAIMVEDGRGRVKNPGREYAVVTGIRISVKMGGGMITGIRPTVVSFVSPPGASGNGTREE